jgi:hypothetical protein
VSKTAWLKEYEHEHVGNVYSRTHQITGLNMETSEELQVSNYGIGGHYEPHFDFARKEEKNAFASLGTGETSLVGVILSLFSPLLCRKPNRYAAHLRIGR